MTITNAKQCKVVVGARVVRLYGQCLLETSFSFGPASLEVIAVAHVAEDIGVGWVQIEGAFIEAFGFLKLSLPVMENGQPHASVGAFLVALNCLGVALHGGFEVALLFRGPRERDVNIGLLRARNRLDSLGAGRIQCRRAV